MPYFTPDKRQCLILGNYDYSTIRFMGVGKDENPKELGFADIPEVLQDMEVFSRNIERYNFDADLDIVKKTNLSMAAVRKLLSGYQSRIAANSRANLKTLTVVYYAGHGMMNEN